MKKKVLSAFIVFMAFFGFGIINVNANTSYDSIVYVTDNSNFGYNFYYIVSDTTYILNDIEWYYIPNDNSLYLVEYCYNNGLYIGVEDSCFILECSHDFDLKPYNANNHVGFDLYDYYLTEMFSELKANNNDVVFICNTDQDRFDDLNFLSYVDFHIDTDVFYPFMCNVFDKIESSYSSTPISGYSFLINKGLYDYSSNIGFENTNIFQYYIKPYLQYYYNLYFTDDWEYLDYMLNDTLDDSIGIRFYYNTSGSEYHLAYHSDSFEQDLIVDISNNDFPGTDYCFLGMSYSTDLVSDAYLYQTISDRNNYDSSRPIFYYNYYSGAFANYNNEIALFYANSSELSTPTIGTMLSAFLNGDNMIPYDNWYGMANITHKMINLSNNGWMNHSSVKACWKLNFVANPY